MHTNWQFKMASRFHENVPGEARISEMNEATPLNTKKSTKFGFNRFNTRTFLSLWSVFVGRRARWLFV